MANKHNIVICQIQWAGWQIHLFPFKSLSLLFNYCAFNFLYPVLTANSYSIFIPQSVTLKFLIWLVCNIPAESTSSDYACPQTFHLFPQQSGLSDYILVIRWPRETNIDIHYKSMLPWLLYNCTLFLIEYKRSYLTFNRCSKLIWIEYWTIIIKENSNILYTIYK